MKVVTEYSPIWVFFVAFAISALAGIAAFLRSGNAIKVVSVLTSGLNSGLLGLAIALVWYEQYKSNIYMLMGFCVISGLMGAAGLDFVINLITKKANFSISTSTSTDKNLEDKVFKQEGKIPS
jgi:hypothetical protein